MKNIFTLLFLLFTLVNVNAQINVNCDDESLEITITQGDGAFNPQPLIIENDGDPIIYFTYGQDGSFDNPNNALIKFDDNGQVVWSKKYDEDIFQNSDDIITTLDGSIYTLSGGRNFGGSDLRKSDANGNQLWHKEFDLPTPTVQYFISMVPNDNGGVTLLGENFISGVFFRELLIINLNAEGEIVWEKKIGDPAQNQDLEPSRILKTPTGEYILVAYADYNLTILKISESGELIFSKIYNFEVRKDAMTLIVNESQTGFYFMYERGNNIASITSGIAEIDFDGNLIRAIDLENNLPIRSRQLSLLADGRLIAEGQMFSSPVNSVFIRLDADWNVEDAKNFNPIGQEIPYTAEGKSHVIIDNYIYKIRSSNNLARLQKIPVSFATECPSTPIDVSTTSFSFSGQNFNFQSTNFNSDIADFAPETSNFPYDYAVVCSSNVTTNSTDLSVEFQDSYCQNGTVFLDYSICNLGEEILPAGLPVSAFGQDPTVNSTNPSQTFNIPIEIAPNTCYESAFQVEGYDEFYLVINEDGTQNTPFDLENFASDFISECDYTNNIASVSNIEDVSFFIGTQTLLFCEGESFEFNGLNYTESATVSQNLASSEGCDSISITEIEMLPIIFTEETLEYLEGETAFAFGESYTESTIVQQVFDAENGCDSLHQIEIIFLEEIFTSEIITACEGETVSVFGNDYTSAGIFEETFVSFLGSDSTHQISLIFNQPSFQNEVVQACDGEVVTVFDISVTESGDYSDLFVGSNGCDSTLMISITFLEDTFTSETIELCEGETINIYGQTITENTSVEQSFIAESSCDSTHIITVIFTNVINTSETITACTGESVEIFGSEIFNDVVLEETFLSNFGCDSIHQVTVVFFEGVNTFETLEFCVGETATIFGNDYIENDVAEQSLLAANGCDSIHQVTLIFNETFETTEIFELCEGESISIFGNEITSTQTLSETFTATNGCDSIHQVSVSFFENVFTFETQEYCEGETAIIFGENINENDVLTENFNTQNGCDSLHEITVIFNEEINIFLYDTICFGDSLKIFDEIIFNTGSYEFLSPGIGEDCDTSSYLNLEVLPEIQYELVLDTIIPAGMNWQIPLQTNNENLTFLWSPSNNLTCIDCQNPIALAEENLTYTVLITNQLSCSTTAQIKIAVDPIPAFYIPQAFSPNNDETNDYFTVFGNEKIEIIEEMQIFDRWGTLIFSQQNFAPNKLEAGWDGVYRGQKLSTGVFVYTIRLRQLDGRVIEEAGDFLLTN